MRFLIVKKQTVGKINFSKYFGEIYLSCLIFPKYRLHNILERLNEK
jgi:hypothetical protein